MNRSGLLLLVYLCFCLEVLFCSEESSCVELSKFDYEFKIVQKMAQMESDKKELDAAIAKFESIISGFSARVQSFETMMSPITSKIGMIDTLQEKMIELEECTGDGTSYIRWGRTSCPGNGTEIIYTGYTAGSVYSQSGGAANRLCMPTDPVWGHYNTGTASGAVVGGAEFEFHTNGGQDFFGRNLKDREPFCSVCISKRRRVLVIPGRNQCYDGWTKEYSGYLTAGGRNDKGASEYLCLDEQPEFPDPMAKSGQDGTKFHLVDVICGSLPCPPYYAGREVTCVVCTI